MEWGHAEVIERNVEMSAGGRGRQVEKESAMGCTDIGYVLQNILANGALTIVIIKTFRNLKVVPFSYTFFLIKEIAFVN